MLQIVMFIVGLIVLYRGEITISKGKVVRGWRARIIGGILAMVVPLGFCIGFVLGVMGSMGGMDLNQFPVILADLGVLAACGMVAAILSFIWVRPVAEWEAEKLAASNAAALQPLPPSDFNNPYQTPHTH